MVFTAENAEHAEGTVLLNFLSFLRDLCGLRGKICFSFLDPGPYFFNIGNPFASRSARYAWAQSRASFRTRPM